MNCISANCFEFVWLLSTALSYLSKNTRGHDSRMPRQSVARTSFQTIQSCLGKVKGTIWRGAGGAEEGKPKFFLSQPLLAIREAPKDQREKKDLTTT